MNAEERERLRELAESATRSLQMSSQDAEYHAAASPDVILKLLGLVEMMPCKGDEEIKKALLDTFMMVMRKIAGGHKPSPLHRCGAYAGNGAQSDRVGLDEWHEDVGEVLWWHLEDGAEAKDG